MTPRPVRLARRLAVLSLCVAMGLPLGCASSGRRKADDEGRPKRTILMTSRDDEIAGREASESVESEIGILDDPMLTAYVEGIGRRLLRGLPYRQFAFRFAIVDQMEPNAFALPGGYIYVSRGLLALANSEDELACVLGHEIIHATRRHAAQQQAVERSLPGLSLPRSRAQTLAAYGRDMEREADELGQRLAAAAGYDPMGMATFMRRLDQRERLLIGAPRNPTFLDTHPGTRERATVNAMRSGELRWSRDPSLGDTRLRLLDRIDGMVIGDRPETGVFVDEWFLHPELDFEVRFPKGWRQQNSNRVVGAASPRRDAAVYLTSDMPSGDLVALADEFAEKQAKEVRVRVEERSRVRLGDVEAVRYRFGGGPPGLQIEAQVTFFPFAGATWRMVGLTPAAAADRYRPDILLATRSFGPLSPERREAIRVDRLHVVLAREGEDVVALTERTDNVWSPSVTALFNGQLGIDVYQGGELVKVLRRTRLEDADSN